MSEAKITLSAEDKTRAAFAGVKRSLLDLKDTGDRLNTSFGGLGVVLGSAFAGVSLTSFLRSTLEGIDRLNDIKDASGSSIESISALEDIAARLPDASAAGQIRLYTNLEPCPSCRGVMDQFLAFYTNVEIEVFYEWPP